MAKKRGRFIKIIQAKTFNKLRRYKCKKKNVRIHTIKVRAHEYIII